MFFGEEGLFLKKICKKSHIQYQRHYIQKEKNKGKKVTRNIKYKK